MKRLLKATAILFCAATIATIISPAAKADMWDKKTTITFSNPVEIPGVHLKGFSVLPAGTYVFKLLNSQSDRHIVQIFSQDEKTVYATILAIPNMRITRTDETVVTFRERPAGEPPALRAWFYPGATWGDEFVYPKARAAQIASTMTDTSTPVLYSNSDAPSEVVEPIQAPEPQTIAQLNDTPVLAFNQGGQQVELAQAVTPPEPRPSAAPSSLSPAPEMPHTASFFWDAMAIGFLALAGAIIVRWYSRYWA